VARESAATAIAVHRGLSEVLFPKEPRALDAAIELMLPALMADAIDPADPMDAIDPAEPTDNTDPALPTDPMDSTLPDDAMLRNDPSDHSDHWEGRV